MPTSWDLCLWAAFGLSGGHGDQPPGPAPTCLPPRGCRLLSASGSFTGLPLGRPRVACSLHLVDLLDPQLPSISSLTSPSASCDLVMILYLVNSGPRLCDIFILPFRVRVFAHGWALPNLPHSTCLRAPVSDCSWRTWDRPRWSQEAKDDLQSRSCVVASAWLF